MLKANCDYYIEGKADAAELAEKYAQCVSVCPDELPVHSELNGICKTCTCATGASANFWLGRDKHTEDSCRKSCPTSFYKVMGDSYQCVDKCGEHQFAELNNETKQHECVDECGNASFVDSQTDTSDSIPFKKCVTKDKCGRFVPEAQLILGKDEKTYSHCYGD